MGQCTGINLQGGPSEGVRAGQAPRCLKESGEPQEGTLEVGLTSTLGEKPELSMLNLALLAQAGSSPL